MCARRNTLIISQYTRNAQRIRWHNLLGVLPIIGWDETIYNDPSKSYIMRYAGQGGGYLIISLAFTSAGQPRCVQLGVTPTGNYYRQYFNNEWSMVQ